MLCECLREFKFEGSVWVWWLRFRLICIGGVVRKLHTHLQGKIKWHLFAYLCPKKTKATIPYLLLQSYQIYYPFHHSMHVVQASNASNKFPFVSFAAINFFYSLPKVKRIPLWCYYCFFFFFFLSFFFRFNQGRLLHTNNS